MSEKTKSARRTDQVVSLFCRMREKTKVSIHQKSDDSHIISNEIVLGATDEEWDSFTNETHVLDVRFYFLTRTFRRILQRKAGRIKVKQKVYEYVPACLELVQRDRDHLLELVETAKRLSMFSEEKLIAWLFENAIIESTDWEELGQSPTKLPATIEGEP